VRGERNQLLCQRVRGHLEHHFWVLLHREGHVLRATSGDWHWFNVPHVRPQRLDLNSFCCIVCCTDLCAVFCTANIRTVCSSDDRCANNIDRKHNDRRARSSNNELVYSCANNSSERSAHSCAN